MLVSPQTGKEATVGILGEGSFFGEGGLAGQAMRMGSASAMTDCTILRIEKKSMVNALHRDIPFSDMFVTHLPARNIRYEAISGGSTLQFQREEAGQGTSAAGALW